MSEGTKIVYDADGIDFTIYRVSKPTKSGPKRYWVLADHSSGTRRLLNNKTLKAAKQRADKIRIAITKGRADRMMLNNGEWQDVCIALKTLRSTHSSTRSEDSLSSAVWDWAQCIGMLGGRATLLDAVRYFLANHRNGGPPLRSTRFVDAAKAYHGFKVKDGKSVSHCNNIRRRFGRLETVLPPDVRLDDLTAGQLDNAVLSLKLGKKTRNDYRDHLQNLFKWAAKQNPPLVPRGFNPASEMEHHDVGHTDVDFLRVNDLRTILAAIQVKRPDLLPLVVLVCFGALRPSEAARLEWKEVGATHIRLPGKKSKTGYARQIPIQENLKLWLDSWLKAEGLVCPGVSLPHVNAAIRNASGIRLTHDAMRHGYGTHRFQVTKNLAAVADEMGNTPQVCRRHYLNAFCPEQDAKDWFSIVPEAPANIIALSDRTTMRG